MLSLMFRARTVACAIVVVSLAACGGGGSTNPGGGGTTVVQPPPPEVLSLHIDVPPTLIQSYGAYPEATVPITVTASSNKGPVTVMSCTVEGKSCSDATLLPVGSHWVGASARSNVTGAVVKDSVMITILPAKFTGKVVAPTATGEYVPQGAYVIVGDKGAEDSVKVGSDGSFSLNSRYAATQKACFIVRGDPNMGWLSGCVSSSNFGSLVFIGALKSFTPASGDFAGQKIAIDMVKVTQPAPPPSNSSYLLLYAGKVTTFFVGSWKSYPVCIAFSHVQGGDQITATDSLSYWMYVNVVEKKHGMDLAKPCSEEDVKSQGGLTVFLRPGFEGAGVGDGTYGDYLTAGINLESHQAFADEFLVQHTFGHAFFNNGHTCAWDSIMRSSCPRYVPNALTGEDVANDLLKIRTRELERKYNTRFSFAFSINGARLEQGLSELSIPVIDTNGNLVP